LILYVIITWYNCWLCFLKKYGFANCFLYFTLTLEFIFSVFTKCELTNCCSKSFNYIINLFLIFEKTTILQEQPKNHLIILIESLRKISYIFRYGNPWRARNGRSRVRSLRLSRVSYLRQRTLHESRYLASRRNDFSTWMHRYALANWPNFSCPSPKRSTNDRAHEHCRPFRESPMKPTIYRVGGNS